MVSELMGESAVWLDFCRHSPFYIAHHNASNGELPIYARRER
jgi:hypothetical protein